MLLTSCGDNICRLWAETPSYEPFSVYCAASIAGELQALQSADGTVAPFVLHWLNTQELYEASPGPVVKVSGGLTHTFQGSDNAHDSAVTFQETTPVPPGAERDLVGLNLAPDRTESSTSHRALRRIHSQNDMAFSEKASAHGHKGEVCCLARNDRLVFSF